MENAHKSEELAGTPVDLEGCLIQVEASKAWFARRVLPLSLDQVRWRPYPAGWSIAECLDHLNLTLALYLPKIDEAIDRGRREAKTTGESPRLPWVESEALKWVEPPAIIRIPSPAAIAPAASVDPDTLIDKFDLVRDYYSEAVYRASGLDLGRIVIREPIHDIIQTLGGALTLLAAHERRHLWQAEQVRQRGRKHFR